MASKIYIGDSLGEITDDYLRGIKCNSRGGRASPEGVDVLRGMISGQTRKVYFDLGTNDWKAANLEGSIKQVRNIIDHRELFMSTVRGTDSENKNAMLRELRGNGVLTLVNVHGIDTLSDGIHLTTAGYKAKARLIMAALGSDGATNDGSAGGSQGAAVDDGPYEFERGERYGKREGSWEAITRMATEVNWRAFMLKDTLCFIAEDDPDKIEMDLFRGAIYATINGPGDERMYSYSGEVDVNKKTSEFNFTYLADRWAFTPGSVVRLQGFSGAYNGRWLVASTRRDYFNPVAEVTLKRPSPSKPEPAKIKPVQTIEDSRPDTSSDAGGDKVPGAIAGSPVPHQRPHAPTHETAGLPGYPAYDYMAKAGTPCVAPVNGKITRLSGKDPSLGGPAGGALGYSIYMSGGGKSYFLTHLDKVIVKTGQRVRQGVQIAQIANGPPSWSTPHVHMGING